MAINYSVAKMLNPQDRESGEYKYYAKAQASGSVGINELSVYRKQNNCRFPHLPATFYSIRLHIRSVSYLCLPNLF